jgi:UDP-N-acetyl-D-glucosamine/UDP-N-acetyl-D-galactosamine dehydrogenase
VPHGRKLAVIGLGYVGLPVAVAFGRQGTPVIGFDIDTARIRELRAGHDRTREVEPRDLGHSTLVFTSDPAELSAADFFIVTVPTPIDQARRPDLTALLRASATVGKALKKGDIVVYESTVYPGATEEDCVPILEQVSGLSAGRDFTVGYSPERINPGDRAHRFETITKVVAGQDARTLDIVAAVYGSVVTAGLHKAPSIKVAEAAKVIENAQRDLNIAFMNELSAIFHQLDIDTGAVLSAAATKWNFINFTPGLVGGHCIGVDPYYLTHRAQEIGYHPEVILAGRRINDGMGAHVANRVARLMMKRGFPVVGSRILVMGLAFKENCPDLRNSKVIDLIRGLKEYNAQIEVWDPWVNADEALDEFGLEIETSEPALGRYDAVVMAVGHREFSAMGAQTVRAFGRPGAVFFDLKGVFEKQASDGRL